MTQEADPKSARQEHHHRHHNPFEQPGMKFGSSGASVAGSLSGVALAMGVPWVLLSFGQVLGEGTLKWLVVTTVIAGATMAVLSALLGLVMPSHIGTPPGE
jgi:hypothetical protein